MSQLSERRYGLVTGSRCSSLVPKKSAEVGMRSLAFELASEIAFKYRDSISTWQTEHGHYAEPLALDHYREHYDKDLQKGIFHCRENEGGSTDAEGSDYIVEVKSPTSFSGWLEYIILDQYTIDKKYYDQCQMYMRLSGKRKAYLCAFLMETLRMNDNGDVYPVPMDQRMIRIEVDYDQEWNDKFDRNLPNVIDMRDIFLKGIANRFKK
jgi:hypothetical protein